MGNIVVSVAVMWFLLDFMAFCFLGASTETIEETHWSVKRRLVVIFAPFVVAFFILRVVVWFAIMAPIAVISLIIWVFTGRLERLKEIATDVAEMLFFELKEYEDENGD